MLRMAIKSFSNGARILNKSEERGKKLPQALTTKILAQNANIKQHHPLEVTQASIQEILSNHFIRHYFK